MVLAGCYLAAASFFGEEEMIIVVAKAKQYAKDRHDIRLGKDFLEKLDMAVCTLIDAAVDKAKKDDIGTVKERHLTFVDPTE